MQRVVLTVLLCFTFIYNVNTQAYSDNYQFEGDEMQKCYNKVDINNPKHYCSNVLSSKQMFIPSQTTCIASVYDILPVQYCIGLSIVHCKQVFFESMIAKSAKTFIDFQQTQPTPAMVFYKNNSNELGIYIYNHQHMSFALASSNKIPNKYKYLKICIVNDMRKLFSKNEINLFWKYMTDAGYSYPYNKYYIYKDPVQHMPSHILQLSDDPFRSLSIYTQDYMGFIYCPIQEEDINYLNFSKCFRKNGTKWDNKHGNTQLTLIWSDFLFQKLHSNKYAKYLYENNNTKYQMKLFRELLPLAMSIVLNGSDGSDKLPSFNNQPWKIPDRNDMILYDDGCDIPTQKQIDSMNSTGFAIDNDFIKIVSNQSMRFMDKYLICICITGIVAMCIRYFREKIRINKTYQPILTDVDFNHYGT